MELALHTGQTRISKKGPKVSIVSNLSLPPLPQLWEGDCIRVLIAEAETAAGVYDDRFECI